jgi:hypothetical protein
LDAAVAELANVLVTVAIDADVVGITELAWGVAGLAVGAEEIAVGVKDLDAMVAGIGDVKVTETIEAEAFGAVESGVGGGARADEGRERAVGDVEALDAFGDAVFADEDVALRGDGDGAREGEVTGVGAVTAPLFDELTAGREVINAGVVRFEDNDITAVIAVHAFGFA